MKVQACLCLQMCLLATVAVTTSDAVNWAEVDKAQVFCGVELTTALSFCIEHNTRRTRYARGIRLRRQVSDECCKKSCKLRYMLESYCATYKFPPIISTTPPPRSNWLIKSPAMSQEASSSQQWQKNHSPESNDSRQDKSHASGNSIHKDKRLDNRLPERRPPAVIYSITTRPPILYNGNSRPLKALSDGATRQIRSHSDFDYQY